MSKGIAIQEFTSKMVEELPKVLFKDRNSLLNLIKTCGQEKNIVKVRKIHMDLQDRALISRDVYLTTALIRTYTKCGAMREAREVFEQLGVRDVLAWNTLLAGYAQLGQTKAILNMVRKMRTEGILPDLVTFLVLLVACNHSGFLAEGEILFDEMWVVYCLPPTLEHYACMIDLFGRSGHFDEAVEAIKRMPTLDYLPMWSSLLGSCKKWGNVEVGKLAFDHCVQLDEHHVAGYVNMRNIFAADSALEENQEPK